MGWAVWSWLVVVVVAVVEVEAVVVGVLGEVVLLRARLTNSVLPDDTGVLVLAPDAGLVPPLEPRVASTAAIS